MQRVARRLEELKPGVADEETLREMAVPPRAQVQDFRDREQDWQRRLRDARQESSAAQRERDAALSAFERMVHDEEVVSAEELRNARERRDALWVMVKFRHVQGKPIPDEFGEEAADLAGAFEPAMVEADDLADRRFDHAEAAGRLAEMKRSINEQEKLLDLAQKKKVALVEESDALKSEWASLWNAVPFDPLPPEAMLEWLDACRAVFEAAEERNYAETALASVRHESDKAKRQLLNELKALEADTTALEQDGLNVIVEHAAERQQAGEAEAEGKARLRSDLEDVAKALTGRGGDFEQAQQFLDDWEKKWAAAIGELDLSESSEPEAVSAQVDTIDLMRETARSIRSLRNDRIDKIKRDVVDFDQVVAALVADIAADLTGQPARRLSLPWKRRLDEAERSGRIASTRMKR